ncbi:MAG: FAD-binding protein [Myxococcota bacterium]|nr:FAD-binding protein [Myxococcota bacterium]
MPDILVVGSGLAGSVAALQLKARGADVAMASRSWGVTSMSTGALDLAYSPALSPSHNVPRTIAEHIMDIVAHRRRHPYAVMGVEKTVQNLRQGWNTLKAALEGTGLDIGDLSLEAENGVYASSLGVGCFAGAVFGPHRRGDLGRWSGCSVGFLSIVGYGGFNPGRIQAGLHCDLQAMGLTPPTWVDAEVDLGLRGSGVSVAKGLETEPILERLLKGARALAGRVDCVIAPPVLGLDSHQTIRERLGEVVGAPVVEGLGNVPSVPGIRLQRALDGACAKAGIERLGGVASVDSDSDRVSAVTLEEGTSVPTGSLVLATGRFVSGGVAWGESCTESLLGLPVITELGSLEVGSPHPVVRGRPEESHPLMTAGVQVNRALQPMREGHVAFENVFAAGMVVGGFASRYALCADGVALSTACAAAEGALGVAS